MGGIYDVDKASMLRVLDVGDSIFYIESEKNPLARLMKRGRRPTQMIHSWPAQLWEDFPLTGTMDGADKTDGYGHTATTPLQNCVMQLTSQGWMVSRQSQNTIRAGVKDEVAKQTADDAFSFARQIDRQIGSAAPARVQDKGVPYQSGGLFWWLDPSPPASDGENTYLTTPAAFRATSAMRYTGGLNSLTEAGFEAMLRACAEAQNAPVDFTGVVGSSLKRAMSLWVKKDTTVAGGSATLIYTLGAKEKRLQQMVDFFEFDAGSVRTIQTFNLACDVDTGAKTAYSARSGAFIDLKRWELCWMEPVKAWRDDTKSGGPRGHHDALFALRCNMPAAQASVYTNAD